MKKYFFLFIGSWLLAITTEAQTVTDIDGNVYNVVTIGSQQWMKENLKATHYSNGDPIPNVWDQNAWEHLSSGARCYWGIDSISNDPIYGALYNWYAIGDSRNICPSGWHVPSHFEWNLMDNYLDSTVDTTLGPPSYFYGLGTVLKDTNQVLWHGGGGTNTSNFSGLPGGDRWYAGIFSCITSSGFWWTSTSFIYNTDTVAWYRGVVDNATWEQRDTAGVRSGLSVRCICNSQASSIRENKNDKQLLIYPNPATDLILINVAEAMNAKMQVYNMTGACVMQKELINGVNGVNISALSGGVYLVKLEGSDWTAQGKFTKE